MRRPLTLATICLAAIPLLPRTAAACGAIDPCDLSDKWQKFDLVSTTIGTDGVLLFDARRGSNTVSMSDAQALAHVDAQVLADGQPIAGSFAVADGWKGVIWRPDTPLAAGASLSISLTIDNAQLPDSEDECVPSELALGPFAVQVSDGPTPALESVSVGVVTEHIIEPSLQFDTLVCCDGAYPFITDECGPVVTWGNTGSCRANAGHGRLAAMWELDLGQLPAELAGSVSWRLVTPAAEHTAPPGLAKLSLHDDQVICAHVEVFNHVTGDILALEQQCLGAEHAGELGPIELDPAPELAAVCAGQPYVCDVDNEAWDPDACEPFGGGNGDGDGDSDGDGETGEAAIDVEAKGCTIDSRSPSPWLAAGLLLLLGFVRRRDS